MKKKKRNAGSQQLVLNALNSRTPMSRSEISERTELPLPSVQYSLRRLHKKGLVEKVGDRRTAKWRKALAKKAPTEKFSTLDWGDARAVAARVSRTPTWVNLRGRQKKIRRKRVGGVVLYNISDALAIKIKDRPEKHRSVKAQLERIRWILDGTRFGEISASEAVEKIDRVVRDGGLS